MITGTIAADEADGAHAVKICDQCKEHEGQHFAGKDPKTGEEIWLCTDCENGDHGFSDLDGVQMCNGCGENFPEGTGVTVGPSGEEYTLCPKCAVNAGPDKDEDPNA